ncbi:(2Fe-2S)-binding protein [Hyphomonas sp. GM-8P]|jgi:isoquinoline 1-oxidoreductase alpha subunit|uniref:(2Fe-2S)-binding protein n=1 Tax=Hyphomonas sp. GM-8P TaxID=1280945 RepID=UPI000DBFF984|nr:(2Fe-2S)-binding protein [Hyphomonas sp. GM-8P]RAN40019.1 (2Fe-2S)-binding protein [Hyphomonas sp. GM-8P]
MATLKVNGQVMTVDVDDSTPLLWVIREQLGLTGTKYGCGIAECGACTIHIDGQAVRSCVYPVGALAGDEEITTIEGLSEDGSHPVQQAWVELDVPQCGFCQPGMIMAAAGLLNDNPDATDEDIDATITNICRCGTFTRVRKGIHLAKTKKA